MNFFPFLTPAYLLDCPFYNNELTVNLLIIEKRLRNKEVEFFKMLLDNDFVHSVVEDAWKWDPTYDSKTRMTIFEIKRRPAPEASEVESKTSEDDISKTN